MLNEREVAQIEQRLRTEDMTEKELAKIDRLVQAIREYDLAYRAYFYGDIIANLKNKPAGIA